MFLGKAKPVQLLIVGPWLLTFILYCSMYVLMAVLSKAFSQSLSLPMNGGSRSPCRSLSDTQEHACLCLVFAVGSSGAGSGLQSQPLVVEGILVLVLRFFHCGKRRHSNYAPRSVLKSLLLKALLPCAAECSWFHVEQRRVN